MTTVFLTPQSQKDLKKIDKTDRIKIVNKLSQLNKNLLAGKKLVGKLSEFYSLRAWPYRIIYQIINKEVWVVHIMHRKEVYKKV